MNFTCCWSSTKQSEYEEACPTLSGGLSFQLASGSLGIKSGGGTPELDVVKTLDDSISFAGNVIDGLEAGILSLGDAAFSAFASVLLEFDFQLETSEFSSLFMRSFAGGERAVPRLNLFIFLARNKGFLELPVCKIQKNSNY